jgi:hypothetical protein
MLPSYLPEAGFHPAAGEVVEDGQVLGDAQRVALQRRQRDPEADPDPGGGGRDRAGGDERRGAVSVLLAVVLGQPDVVDAQPVGLGRQLDALAIGLVEPLAEVGTALERERDPEAGHHRIGGVGESWRARRRRRRRGGVHRSPWSRLGPSRDGGAAA